MRIAKVLLLLTLCMYAAVSASSQSKYPAQAVDRFDEAHRNLGQQLGADPAPAAGQFTEAVSRSLLQKASSGVEISRRTLVDEYLFARMERDHIPHASRSTDEEFIRRVYLDVAGVLPTADAVRQFVASTEPQKRDNLIDSLLRTEEFTEQWAWFWGDLFRLENTAGDGTNAFQYWMKEWLRVDRPYNLAVHDLLTGVAKSHSSIPALGFFGKVARRSLKCRIPTDPDNFSIENRLDAIDEFSADIGRIFLGINTDCISCHDGAGHLESINLYLSNKTREEFSKQAAFFGRTRVVATWNVAVSLADGVVDDLARGYDTGNDAPFMTASENRFPRDGRTYEPAFLLTGERPRPGVNPREELARLVTNDPQFSRATVNLIWGKLMTVGFVEPYDAFDLARLDPKNPPPKPWSIQPNHPELLETLAVDFREHNFSIRHLLETILKSSAYQLSSNFDGEWKEAYAPYYARKFVRVLTGPEVVDALAQATGRPVRFNFSGTEVERVKGLAVPNDVRRAMPVNGEGGRPASEGSAVASLMQSFFQSNRETPPTTGNKASTLQTILMMSSDLINSRVLAENGTRVQILLDSGKSDPEIVDEMYLATLARWPTQPEKQVALDAFKQDRKSAAQDLQWSLLNGIEFVLNR